MVKILLGVTRESVMRLDAETKEVLKVWSLTTLRRWAASPNRYVGLHIVSYDLNQRSHSFITF